MREFIGFSYYQPYKNKKDGSIYNQMFFSTVMKVKDISELAHVLYYGVDEYGYQRKIEDNHLKKLKKAILNNELVSPTSILLGIQKSVYDTIKKDIDSKDSLLTKLFIDVSDGKKIFSIIDGQHRIEAFKQLTEDKKIDINCDEYFLNTIIMVIDDNNRRVEVDAFNDINSKAKRLKTDLTMLALLRIKQLEGDLDFNAYEYLTNSLCYSINNLEGWIWQNAIIYPENNKVGIIGYKAFYESIEPICKEFYQKAENKSRTLGEMDNDVNEIINNLLRPCWDTVERKWSKCFNEEKALSDDGFMIKFYNKDYNLQKPIGVRAINSIISDLYKLYNINEVVNFFVKIMENCNISKEDWESGGKFSGLSSEAGFKVVKKIITKGYEDKYGKILN